MLIPTLDAWDYLIDPPLTLLESACLHLPMSKTDLAHVKPSALPMLIRDLRARRAARARDPAPLAWAKSRSSSPLWTSDMHTLPHDDHIETVIWYSADLYTVTHETSLFHRAAMNLVLLARESDLLVHAPVRVSDDLARFMDETMLGAQPKIQA